MKKGVFLHVLAFLLLVSISYSLVPDADKDGVPDENDKCPDSDTTIVDQFGCTCSQKNCPSDNNECTNDCSVVNGLATCTFANNNKCSLTPDVEIIDNAFRNSKTGQSSVIVRTGTTVLWRYANNGQSAHSIVWDTTGPSNSNLLRPGNSYSQTFNSPGTFNYHCGVHGQSMSGSVLVGCGGQNQACCTIGSSCDSGLTCGSDNKCSLSTADDCKDDSSVTILEPLPVSLSPGQQANFRVKVTNKGNTWWYHGDVYRFVQTSRLNIVSTAPENVRGLDYGHFTPSVLPGNSAEWSFELTAPSEPGTYELEMQTRHRGGNEYIKPDKKTCPAPKTDIHFGERLAQRFEVRSETKCTTDADCEIGACKDGSTYKKYECSNNQCIPISYFQDPCLAKKSICGNKICEEGEANECPQCIKEPCPLAPCKIGTCPEDCERTKCPLIYEPVCGDDGITYSNTCEVDAAGVKIACKGKCPCAECSTNFQPVCGADGRTYGNECEANRAGVKIQCLGECPCAEEPRFGYRFATWACHDDYAESQGSESSCKSLDLWYEYASRSCADRCSTASQKCGVNAFSVRGGCGKEVLCSELPVEKCSEYPHCKIEEYKPWWSFFLLRKERCVEKEPECKIDNDCPIIDCIQAPCPKNVCVDGKCIEGGLIPITDETDEGSISAAHISGDKVIYERNIYLIDLNTKQRFRVSPVEIQQYQGDIDGNRIVWFDTRNLASSRPTGENNGDIFMYDINSQQEIQVTTDGIGDDEFPAVSGDYIVYQRLADPASSTGKSIWLYDINTKSHEKIAETSKQISPPDISGNNVVWADNAVKVYSLITKKTTDIAPASVGLISEPKISQNYVVWEDNSIIFVYNLETNGLEELSRNGNNPVVSNGKVAWIETLRDGTFVNGADIVIHDLITKQENRISNRPFSGEGAVDIDNNEVVWVELFAGDRQRVMLYKIPSGQCTDSDGGKDYFVQGRLYIQDVVEEYDACFPDGLRLTEHYCTEDSYSVEHFECPNGCKDGACIQRPVKITCTDSDNGKNYFVKGTLTVQDFTIEDSCSSDLKLVEHYCTEDAYSRELFKCPNVCKDGACIKPVCGNKILETGEECDDGQASNGACPARCNSSCIINSCPSPREHLKYFSYFGSDYIGSCGNNRCSAEIADHSNVAWVLVNPALIKEASDSGMGVIVNVYHAFMENGRLKPDYLSEWNKVSEILRPYVENGDIVAFYHIDEPDASAGTKNMLETINFAIKQKFPQVPIAIVYGWGEAKPGLTIPEGFDWIGFDCYNSWEDCRIPLRFNHLKNSLKNGQRIILIPDGQIVPPGILDPDVINSKLNIINNYYELALSEPSVIGIFPYLWASYQQPDGLYRGTRDIPEIRNRYKEIGKEIVGERIKICGNKILETGEQCDDGQANNGACPARCSSSCKLNNCQPEIKTCAEQNGDICTADEICPGRGLDAIDTARCCSVQCTVPSWQFCSQCGQGLFNICDRAECNSIAELCYFLPAVVGGNCNKCAGASCESYSNQQTCEENHCNFNNCAWVSNSCITQQPSNQAPIGWLDGISNQGIIWGWALDMDQSSESITVHIYFDGPAGNGTFIGAVTTNIPRGDVNRALGITGIHGYSFTIPNNYRDGQQHSIYVYGIDLDGGGSNVLLSGVPKSFTLGTSTTPTVDIKANGLNGPITVAYNGSAAVSWTSTNVNSCTVNPGGWTGISGSQNTGALTSSVIYILNCTGAGRTVNDSVTVNVGNPPQNDSVYVGYYWAGVDPDDYSTKIDQIREVAPYTNFVDIKSVQGAQEAKRLGLKGVFYVDYCLFEPRPGGGYRLKPDWQSSWQNCQPTIQAIVNEVDMFAFYIFDEPYGNQVTKQELETAISAVKQRFPSTPTMITETCCSWGPNNPPPNGIDIYSVTCYADIMNDTWRTWCRRKYENLLGLFPGKILVTVPTYGYQPTDPPVARIPPQERWYNLTRDLMENPRFIGIWWFLYSNCEICGFDGTRPYQDIRAYHNRTGREILGR